MMAKMVSAASTASTRSAPHRLLGDSYLLFVNRGGEIRIFAQPALQRSAPDSAL
jgi:hypothetical protein